MPRTTLHPISTFAVADVDALLSSAELREVQDPVAVAIGLPILPHRYAADHQAYLRFIDWDISTIRSLLISRRENLIRFQIAMHTGERPHQFDEEYPEGEEPDPDDLSTDTTDIGIENGFALRALVYFFLLDRSDLKYLDAYLKLLRIPHALAFRKRLQRYYTAGNVA